MAGLLRRRLPLQDYLCREPQAWLQRRYHLCGLQYDAARPGPRRCGLPTRTSARATAILLLPVLGETGADGIVARRRFWLRPASISTESATRQAIRALRNGSSSATAVISTRCSPSHFRLRRRSRLSHKFGGLDGWSWPNGKKGGAVTARRVAGDPDQDKIRRLRRG